MPFSPTYSDMGDAGQYWYDAYSQRGISSDGKGGFTWNDTGQPVDQGGGVDAAKAYVGAPTRLDPQGNYTEIQNKQTGQWEIAYNASLGGQPVAVPKSIAEGLGADVNMGPIQQSRAKMSSGLGDFAENMIIPALSAAFLGPAGLAYSPEAVAASAAAAGGAAAIGGSAINWADPSNWLADASGATGTATDAASAASTAAEGAGGVAGSGAGLPSWALPAAGVAAPVLSGGASDFSNPFGTATPGSMLDVNTPLSQSLGDFQAAPGSALDLYSPLTTGGVGGAGLTLSQLLDAAKTGGTLATGAKSLSQLLGVTGDSAGAVDALGRAIPGLVGAYAANQQGSALTDLANKYTAFGAPSRARYEASMTPGFDATSIPGYSDAVDNSMQATLRKLSTQGNPFGNPGGLIEANKAVVSGTALPAIQEYQRANLAGGGLANMNAAVPGLDTSALNANSNVFNALGSAASSAVNPPTTLAQLLQQLKGYGATAGGLV